MHNLVRITAVVLLLVSLQSCKRFNTAKNDGDADAHQAMLLIEKRKFTEALPLLKSSLDKELSVYSKSTVLTSIGNCYNELEDFEQSLQYHDKAIAADPNNHQAYVNKGIVYRLQGDYDQAEKCYMKALSLAPDYAELHASMGALAIFRDDPNKAIKHLKQAIKLDDTLAVAHTNLSVAYAMNGQFDEAEAALKRAVLRGYHQPELIRERIKALRDSQ